MKKSMQLMYVIIIFSLSFIVIYQCLTNKNGANNSFIIPFSELNDLITEKKKTSSLYYYNKEKDKFVLIDEVLNVENLGKYCCENRIKDSIDKYAEIASFYLSSRIKNNSILCKNLYSDNKNQRIYSCKLLEYMILDGIIYKKEREYYQFDLIQVLLFSNAQFKKDTLNFGEELECFISIGANNFYNPIRIKIDGENEIIMDNTLSERYIRPTKVKGENEIKGEVTYFSHGKEYSLKFSRKYYVN